MKMSSPGKRMKLIRKIRRKGQRKVMKKRKMTTLQM